MMTIVNQIPDIDLEKFTIYFGFENGREIYNKYLRDFTNPELGKAQGYITRTNCGSIVKKCKTGRYLASRFKMMCNKLKIDPEKIESEYDFKIFQRFGSNYLEVEEPLKNAVWNKICDVR